MSRRHVVIPFSSTTHSDLNPDNKTTLRPRKMTERRRDTSLNTPLSPHLLSVTFKGLRHFCVRLVSSVTTVTTTKLLKYSISKLDPQIKGILYKRIFLTDQKVLWVFLEELRITSSSLYYNYYDKIGITEFPPQIIHENNFFFFVSWKSHIKMPTCSPFD